MSGMDVTELILQRQWDAIGHNFLKFWNVVGLSWLMWISSWYHGEVCQPFTQTITHPDPENPWIPACGKNVLHLTRKVYCCQSQTEKQKRSNDFHPAAQIPINYAMKCSTHCFEPYRFYYHYSGKTGLTYFMGVWLACWTIAPKKAPSPSRATTSAWEFFGCPLWINFILDFVSEMTIIQHHLLDCCISKIIRVRTNKLKQFFLNTFFFLLMLCCGTWPFTIGSFTPCILGVLVWLPAVSCNCSQ